MRIIFLLILFLSLSAFAQADSLNIDTDYRLRAISYTNNDFNDTTNDSIDFYSHRLKLSFIGQFNEGIEIGSKLSAFEVIGSTTTLFQTPYQKTDFTPNIENAYLKITKFINLPADVTIGKQNLEYGDGLIIGDNGVGYNAALVHIYDMRNIFTSVGGFVSKPFKNTGVGAKVKKISKSIYLDKILYPFGFLYEKLYIKKTLSSGYSSARESVVSIAESNYPVDLFTAKISEGFYTKTDRDIYGFIIGAKLPKHKLEFMYFEDYDYSAANYNYAGVSNKTSGITKNFYDLRLTRKEKVMEYSAEAVWQRGTVSFQNAQNINFLGYGYLLKGKLIAENTKIGKVAARTLFLNCSGDDNPADDNDESFSPSFTKRYDGLEKSGFGKLFALNPVDTALPVNSNYSGLNVFSVGTDLNPIYGWDIDITYFLYSTSKGPKDQTAPKAKGLEQILVYMGSLGKSDEAFIIGLELDLGVKYVFSKYLDLGFYYCRYTPPAYNAAGYWPTRNPATYYQFELHSRF